MWRKSFVLTFLFLTCLTVLCAQQDYYLPQVANGQFAGGSLRTTFVLFNTSTTSASVSMTLTRDDGGPLRVTIPELGSSDQFSLTLEGGGTRILQTDGSGTAMAGAARVSSSALIGVSAIFSIFDASGNFLTEAGVGSSEPVTEVIIPVDATGTFNTGVALFNFGTTPASLTLRLLDTSGQEKANTTQTLAPKAHLARFVSGEFFANVSNFRGTLVVSSTTPIAAVTVRQNSSPLSFTTLPAVARSSARLNFNLPQVADGPFGGGSFRTTFLLFNISSNPATVKLALSKDDGSPFSVTIAGQGTNSTFTLNLDPGGSAFLQSDGKGALSAGAAKVTSNVPIGVSAIFSIFDSNGNFVTESGIGASLAQREFTLPVDITGKFDTGVAFFNPSPEPVTLTVKLLDGKGATVKSTQIASLAGGNHTAKFVSELFSGTSNFRGSLSVSVSGSITGTIAALTLRQNSAPLSFTSLPVASRPEVGNPINVTVTLDSSRAVSAEIPETGGTLTTTDAKGNKFTLAMPDKALLSSEKITMTPMASASGAPLSGGVVAAVQLEPEGLVLYQPATLTIEPATPIPPEQATPIAWRNAGEGMILYPPELGTPKLVFKLSHFSGYGAGISNDKERAAIALHAALSAEDKLTSREGALALKQWAADLAGVKGDPQFYDERQSLMVEYYELSLLYIVQESLRSFALELKRDDLLRCALLKSLTFERRLEVLGATPLNNSMSAAISEFIRKASDLLLKNALDRCQNTPGPSSVVDILGISRQRALLGIGEQGFTVAELQKLADKCTSFELQFTSEMKGILGPHYGFTAKVSAKVPLKLFPKSTKELTGSGSGPIDYLSFQMTDPACPPGCTCTFATKTTGSTFTVFQERGPLSTLIEFDFNEKEKPSSNPSDACQLERELRPKAITLVIDPGTPIDQFSETISCPDGSTTAASSLAGWLYAWLTLHAKEGTIKDWELLGAVNTAGGPAGELYARKVYDRSLQTNVGTFTEKTTLELFHRPQ